MGGVCFTTLVFSIFLGATWANISVWGRVGKTLCGFCCWGISESWYFRIGFWEAGLAEELVEFFPFFFFLLSNLPFGFTVPWVDGGLAAAWFHFYILIFCFLPVLILYGLHLGYGYGGRGGTFRIFCYGSLGCSGGFIYCAHSRLSLCLGLAGLGWQSIFGTLGSGRVAKRCCLLVVHNVGSVGIGSVRSGQGGRCFEKQLVCSKAVVG